MDRKTVSGRKLVFWVTAIAPLGGGVALSSLSLPAHAGEAGVVMAGKVVSVEGRVLIRQEGARDGGGKSPGGGGQAVQMKAGSDVREGDVINTSSDGKAKILLADKTILDIGPSALFKVQKFEVKNVDNRNVDLSMPYGTTRISVTKPISPAGKFQIRTRTATMGVRGTEFVIQADIASSPASGGGPNGGGAGSGSASDGGKASETKITVIQGKVEVVQQANSDAKLSGDSRKPTSESHKAPPPVMLTAGTQLTANADKPMAKAVALDTAQISAVTTSTKIQDNTFAKAVTLDLKSDSSSGSGSGAGSAAGGSTRAAITVAIAAPQNQPSSSSAIVPLSTFGAPSVTSVIPTPTVFIPPGGGISHLHIVVKQ